MCVQNILTKLLNSIQNSYFLFIINTRHDKEVNEDGHISIFNTRGCVV